MMCHPYDAGLTRILKKGVSGEGRYAALSLLSQDTQARALGSTKYSNTVSELRREASTHAHAAHASSPAYTYQSAKTHGSCLEQKAQMRIAQEAFARIDTPSVHEDGELRSQAMRCYERPRIPALTLSYKLQGHEWQTGLLVTGNRQKDQVLLAVVGAPYSGQEASH
jgi:hypothetical protein